MSSSDGVYRDNFHKQLRLFMKDLIKVFPEDRDIKLFSSSLNIAIMDDPNDSVMRKFYQSFSSCESYIETRDERLFYNQIIQSDMELISHLGKYWNQLNIENKEVVWNYLNVLYLLCKSFFVQKK